MAETEKLEFVDFVGPFKLLFHVLASVSLVGYSLQNFQTNSRCSSPLLIPVAFSLIFPLLFR